MSGHQLPQYRAVRILLTLGAAGALVGACSSSSDTTEAATTAPAETSSAAAPETSAAAETSAASAAATTDDADDDAKFGLPPAPSGAKEIEDEDEDNVSYARYSIDGMTAEEVVAGYEKQFKADGFTITNAGGSGGGWGKWGGDGYGMDAEKSGAFASVQAGGSSSGPTYFEVCVGADKSVVDQCGNFSQDDDEDSQSNGS